MKLNVNDLTVGEIADLEDAIGKGIDEIFDDGAPKGRALQGLLWLAHRRDNPALTFEEAGQIKMTDVELELEAEEVPTDAAA